MLAEGHNTQDASRSCSGRTLVSCLRVNGERKRLCNKVETKMPLDPGRALPHIGLWRGKAESRRRLLLDFCDWSLCPSRVGMRLSTLDMYPGLRCLNLTWSRSKMP